MNEEISNATAIAIAAGVAMGILGILALLYDYQDGETHKTRREIKAETCPVKIATACGDEVCKYTARVPCEELEALIKRGTREP